MITCVSNAAYKKLSMILGHRSAFGFSGTVYNPTVNKLVFRINILTYKYLNLLFSFSQNFSFAKILSNSIS